MNLVGLLARASPDGSNLPSASLHQWRARLDPLRLQWLGRSGIKPDSHTTPSHKFYTGLVGASQIPIIGAGRGHAGAKTVSAVAQAIHSQRFVQGECARESVVPAIQVGRI